MEQEPNMVEDGMNEAERAEAREQRIEEAVDRSLGGQRAIMPPETVEHMREHIAEHFAAEDRNNALRVASGPIVGEVARECLAMAAGVEDNDSMFVKNSILLVLVADEDGMLPRLMFFGDEDTGLWEGMNITRRAAQEAAMQYDERMQG